MKSEGVKILIHEAIIASWMRIGKPYKKEERLTIKSQAPNEWWW